MTSEAEEVAWLTPAQVRELMDEAYATRLLDALDSEAVAIRAHDGLSLLRRSACEESLYDKAGPAGGRLRRPRPADPPPRRVA
jgi:hypothetical protein